MWLVFRQATFVLRNEFLKQRILLFIFYSFENRSTVIDDSSVFIKGELAIHFAPRKMTGRTIFYKDGLDLLFKINCINQSIISLV